MKQMEGEHFWRSEHKRISGRKQTGGEERAREEEEKEEEEFWDTPGDIEPTSMKV